MKLGAILLFLALSTCYGAVKFGRHNRIRTHDDETSCSYIQFGTDHTMCKYSEKGCPIIKSGLEPMQDAIIVNLLNNIRNQVASGTNQTFPTATNMRVLKWDDEMASLAQKWANQCQYQHDSNRQTERFKWVGQSVYLERTYEENKSPDFSKVIASWANQMTKFQSSWVKPFRLSYWTSDFSQIVWAKTKYVGCGYSFYAEPHEEYYNKLYVCNYGPGGNYPGESLYEAGPPCEFCDGVCDDTYRSLCRTEIFF